MKSRLLAFGLWAALTATSVAAPLFPDVPENAWARDAVATLAARGIVEGYPDGTFKGDRAATRWEVAMVVARLLARLEAEHATFATRTELEEVRKLAAALREELDALGVRVTDLELATDRLDQRVGELERITFYGSVDTRIGAQTFRNAGSPLSDPTDALIDYNRAVGTVFGAGDVVPAGPAAGLNFDPFTFGVLPVVNWMKGTPLTNGATFTTVGRLGLRVQIAEGLRSEVEFASYTAQGDALVDTYYGASAPYLLNPFTSLSTVTGGLAGVQPANHRPFTRLVLDHLWLRHDPSATELTLGFFPDTRYDRLVYVPMLNPGAFGPEFLGNYGLQAKGETTLGQDEGGSPLLRLDWEAMGTLLPDRNGGVGGAGYFNHAEGLNLGLTFHENRGVGRLNFLHAANDATGGAARQVGLITTVNNTSIPWVNPPGFFFNQLGGPNPATAGIGSTSDVRPVPMSAAVNNDGITGVAGVSNVGNIGPQDQTSLGLSFRYEFDHPDRPRLGLEWARSEYKPQKNSSYSTDGNAWRVFAGAELLEGNLDLDGEYLSVEPRYDPFVLQIPRVGGIGLNHWRVFDLDYFGNLYALHDTDRFPHNRQGFRLGAEWGFAQDARFGRQWDDDLEHPAFDTMLGNLFFRYENLSQHTASLQDVRFSAGALGAGTPNTPVLGFSPGFVEPVFGGFDPATFAPSGGNALAVALESPRGRMEAFDVGASYKFMLEPDSPVSERGVTPFLRYRQSNFFRPSSLQSILGGSAAGTRGESVNFTDFTYSGWTIGVDYDVTRDFTLRGGYDQVNQSGHWDPFGTYGGYAEATGQTRFTNLDSTFSSPFLGFDWEITDNVQWGLEGRLMSMRDHVPADVFPTPSLPALNLSFAPQRSAHPFNWEGVWFSSNFSVKF